MRTEGDRERPRSARTSVVLVHHHALLREGLAALLDSGGFAVVADSGEAREVPGLIEEHQPQLLLIEWDVPGVDEAYLSALVSGPPPTPTVVLMTRPELSEELTKPLRAGVFGCLSVNLRSEDFLAALKVLARGDVVISHDMTAALHDEGPGASKPLATLTARELQVLRLLGAGATNQEIAQELFISHHTAKVHVRRLLAKLGLRNRQHAAAYAAEQGLSA